MTSTPDIFQLCSRCINLDLSPILAREEHLDCWRRGYLKISCEQSKLGPLNSLFFSACTCRVCKLVCETLEGQNDANVFMKKRYSQRGYSCDLVWAQQWRTSHSDDDFSLYRLDIALLYLNSKDRDERNIEVKL